MNDIIIKPSIQHFRLVQETENRINAFINSFLESKLIGLEELLQEENIKFIFFRTRRFSRTKLPKELGDKLSLYNYKGGGIYIIYPSLRAEKWYEKSEGMFSELDSLMSIRNFIGKHNRKRILELIDKKIIIPIKKYDYIETNSYDTSFNQKSAFKQEDYVRKYKLDLDYYEKYFEKEINKVKEDLKESVKFKNDSYYDDTKSRFIVNKYGQPIKVVDHWAKNYYGYVQPKIEVDHKKEQLRLITDIGWTKCILLIDIKTNSIVKVIREPKKY